MASLFGQHIPTASLPVIAQSAANRASNYTGLPLSGGLGSGLGIGIALAGAAPSLLSGVGHMFTGSSYPPRQPYYAPPAPGYAPPPPGAVPGQGYGSNGVQLAPLARQPEPGQAPATGPIQLNPSPATVPGPTQLNPPPQQEWQPGQPIVLRPQPDAPAPEAGTPAPRAGGSRPSHVPHPAGHAAPRPHHTPVDPHQRELNQQAQLYLERMGLDTGQKQQPVDVTPNAAPGKLDGIIGPKTKASLETLRAQGIDPTKPITQETIDKLKKAAEDRAAQQQGAATPPAGLPAPGQAAGATPPAPTAPEAAATPAAPVAAATPITPEITPAPAPTVAAVAPAAPGAAAIPLSPTPVPTATAPTPAAATPDPQPTVPASPPQDQAALTPSGVSATLASANAPIRGETSQLFAAASFTQDGAAARPQGVEKIQLASLGIVGGENAHHDQPSALPGGAGQRSTAPTRSA